MANRYWINTSGGLWSSTANWSTTSGGGGGASVPNSGDSVFFDQAGTYSVTVTSQSCLDLNVSAGTVTFTGTASSFGIYGNINLTVPISVTVVTLSLNGATGGSATLRTIRSSGTTFECPVTVDSGGNGTTVSWQLLDNFTMGITRTFTLNNGKWDINGFVFQTGLFSSNSATNLRAINFGSAFYISGVGTVWQTSTTITTGTLTLTGTPLVTVINSTTTAITVSVGVIAEANSFSFKFQGAAYAITFSSGSTFRNFELAGALMTTAATITVYGNFVFTSGTINNTGVMTFGATSGTKTITSNGNTIDQPVTIIGVGGTFQLADAMTLGATRTFTLTNGTLNLNNQLLTTGFFASSNANARTIAFGTSGSIRLIGATGTLWTTATVTNFAYTGTSKITVDNNTAGATTITPGTLTETQALNFSIISGTYTLTIPNTAAFKNLNFVASGTTGFGGSTVSHTADIIMYGDLTLSSNMTLAASTLGFVFAATSGIQTVTSNGKTFDMPLALNGAGSGGTTKLADAMIIGATRTFNFNNGIFDGNGQSITGATALSASGAGVVSMKGLNAPTIPFTHVSSNLTFVGNNTSGAYTFTLGTLNVNGYTLSCPTFNSSNSNTRTLAFGSAGTGNITCTNAGGTVWATGTTANLTVTGTAIVNISNNSATATTVDSGPATEANSISFNFTTGTYDLTFMSNAGYAVKSIDFTGFSGRWLAFLNSIVIYGNFTQSSGLTFQGSATVSFAATSGTQVITSLGKNFNSPLTKTGAGTLQLFDDLTMQSTRIFTLTNGTVDLNGKTLNAQTRFDTATGTKNLTFNGGTLLCSASGVLAFNNAVPTGFTTTAGTGVGKISMSAATAKTFTGGGSTYNCTLSNDGAGALTITGNNTFTNIANGVSPTSFVFTSGTTQTVTNWNISGTAGNVVTITSSTSGTAANLVKAGGGTVSADYLSIKDSAATPSTLTWYAGPLTHSTDVSGNSGWIFTALPSAANGNFFFMF